MPWTKKTTYNSGYKRPWTRRFRRSPYRYSRSAYSWKSKSRGSWRSRTNLRAYRAKRYWRNKVSQLWNKIGYLKGQLKVSKEDTNPLKRKAEEITQDIETDI